jgi:hypothetical protein
VAVEVADRQVAKAVAGQVLSQVMVVIMEHPLLVAQDWVLVEQVQHGELEVPMVQTAAVLVDLVVHQVPQLLIYQMQHLLLPEPLLDQ